MKRSNVIPPLLAAALVLHASSAFPAPRWLRVSWTITESTDTTMTVSWNDDDAGGGTVTWRESGTTTESSTAATVSDTGDARLDYVYEATITGLLPFTFYEYSVSSGGGTSEWKPFRTAPSIGSCQPFRLAAGGDGRGGEAFWDPGFVSRHWDNIAAEILAERPLAMLYGGDIVHEGEAEQWQEWFSISELLTESVPVMPAIGNHDDGPGEGDGQWYNKMYALPRGGAGSLDTTVDPDGDGVEDMWAIVVGNALLVTLSTEGIDVDVQHAFLDSVLTAYRSRVDWVFLQIHRPLWSSGIGHGSNEDDTLRAADLITYIDDAPVDFVLAGHDHDYERFDPMRGGYGTRPHVINPLPPPGYNDGIPDGTVHIVTGGAGSFTNLIMSCREDGCRVPSPNLHYMVLDVEPLQVTATVHDMGPILTFADAWKRPAPIDTFTIRRATSVCDDVTPDEEPETVEPPPDVVTDPGTEPAPDLPEETPADVPVDTPADPTETDPGDDGPESSGCGCALAS